MSDVLQPNSPFMLSMKLIMDVPLAIAIYDVEGNFLFHNTACERFFGIPSEALQGKHNILRDPQSLKNGSKEMFQQVLARQVYDRGSISFYKNIGGVEGQDRWLSPLAFPLEDEKKQVSHVAIFYRDVTAQVQQQNQIESVQESLAEQKQLIQDLSSPVVRIWEGILLLPLVGGLDASRSMLITERLLEAIVRYEAPFVIVDITGVPAIDATTAHYLVLLTKATSLLGSTVILVGISSEVAQTIVALDIDLSQIQTYSDLQAGLDQAFSELGLHVAEVGA